MDGPGVGSTFELGPTNTLGRANHCNICLDSSGLKEEQATIRRKANHYVIASLGGEVLVNGQPIRQERKLVHGDMITLAEVMLLYGEENENVANSPTPAAAEAPVVPHEVEEPATADAQSPTIKSRQKFYKNTDAALQSIGESKHASMNMEVLIKVSNAIMSKLELRELLQQLLDIVFEQLPADRGTIFLRDQKANKLWPMASKKRGENKASDAKIMASRTIIKEVLDTKEGVLTRDATKDERFQMGLSIAAQQIHAAICVPLVGKNEEVLGVIHIDATRADRVFTDDHLKLVTAIAMQASLAIENALLVQQLGEKKRIEQELAIASNIQMQLLPKAIPQVGGVEVHGLMIPAKEVGGDYYDFLISEDKNLLYTCIGDVSGKGVPAGLVMVMARCFFRPLILSCKNTKSIVEELNKLLVADTRKDMFMSMLVLQWDAQKQLFSWTGAGHEHLLVYRAATKNCEAIRAGGIVLGMMKKAEKFFKEQTLQVAPGDAIILYTDGVTEALNSQNQMFELNHLIGIVEKYGHLSAQKICDSLLEELKKFMGSAPQYDDITIVAIKKL
jgi:serine phosphatase RsbU (regulator of sigma subunit)